MTEHQVATHEHWQAARRALLEAEKEHAERARGLTRRRQPYYYRLLDLAPSGRGNEVRVKRHDEYDAS